MKRYVWPHPPVQPPMPRKNWWDEAISPSARREPVRPIRYSYNGGMVTTMPPALGETIGSNLAWISTDHFMSGPGQ